MLRELVTQPHCCNFWQLNLFKLSFPDRHNVLDSLTIRTIIGNYNNCIYSCELVCEPNGTNKKLSKAQDADFYC